MGSRPTCRDVYGLPDSFQLVFRRVVCSRTRRQGNACRSGSMQRSVSKVPRSKSKVPPVLDVDL